MKHAITLYGIANCDTVRKAQAWLAREQVEFIYHDFKRHGLPTERLQHWLRTLGAQKLLNRQGRTWRSLDAATQQALGDAQQQCALIAAHLSVIKRPVVEWNSLEVTVGFDPADWQARLAARV